MADEPGILRHADGSQTRIVPFAVLADAHLRHPHTQLPEGFQCFPPGVCPWCSGGEGVKPERYVRHGGPCPVWDLEFTEHGTIARMIRRGPDFKRLAEL